MGNTNEGPQGDATLDSSDMPSSSPAMSEEAVMLQKRLNDEFQSMVAEMIDTKEFEAESDIEPEAQKALVRAANEICYTRKYYDISKDEIIYFPSLLKSIRNNSLFELAGKYYEDPFEEFPEEYCMGLRRVSFARMAKDGHDYDDSDGEEEHLDDQLMMRLSHPVAAVTITASETTTASEENENKNTESSSSSSQPTEKPLVWKRSSAPAAAVTNIASAKEGTSENRSISPLIWKRGGAQPVDSATTASPAALPKTPESPLIWKRGTVQPVDLATTAAVPKTPESPLIWKRGTVQPVDLTTTASAKKTPSETTPFQPTGPTLTWKRGSAIADAVISSQVADTFTVEETMPSKNHSVSEDEVQQRLGMRRQASFLRKASILDSLEKFYEPDPMSSAAKKKAANKESEMRLAKIDKELKSMIKEMLQSRDFQDETDMEPLAHKALVKAAKEICYTRKYYDVSTHEAIFIPSIVKTMKDNSLFEKADEYYEEEYEEFPEEYSMALRKVAFARMAAEGLEYHDSDGEEEEVEFAMMMQLSQPVDLPASSTSASKKKQSQTKVLKDTRMDASEETFVWTRSSRHLDAEDAEESMAAAMMAAVPEQQPAPAKKQEPTTKKPAVTEEEVQQRLGMRRQASFLRKAAILDSIGKHETEESLPPIGESSDSGKKKKGLPSKLVDKRLDASEETFVWTRSSRNMDAEASMAAAVAAIPEQPTKPARKEETPAKKPAFTEEEVQQRLSMRRQASFLRKAAILDSIGKNEGEEMVLPSIGESSTKKKAAGPSTLVDKRMDTSEETFVWARSSRSLDDASMLAAMASAPEQPTKPARKEDAPVKKPAVTEEEVQQRLSMRRQASFLRKAAILDSIGKNEGEEMVLPSIGESSTKKKAARPSTLVDKRMDTSEETFVWARSSRSLDDASMLAAVASAPEQPTKPARKEDAPVKKPAVTEEEVQQRLSMRRQASFLRKAAILDSIGKNEGEEMVLPSIGESSTKKKAAGPSTLVDKRMAASEETIVWTRSSRNLGADANIQFEAFGPGQQPAFTKKQDAPVNKPAVTEEEVQQRLSMRRQASFLRKAAILDSIGKNEGEKMVLPSIGESSTKKKAARPSTLVDKRMAASEETMVWTRSNLGADASIQFEAFGPGQQPSFTKAQEAPVKKTVVTEEDIKERLGLRRQASTVRKAAIMDSIGKWETDEASLPEVQNDEVTTETAASDESSPSSSNKGTAPEVSTSPLSEAAKRQDMIDTELNGIIEEMMKSDDFEEEAEMEKESYDAIMKAAKEICYTRKYYDVSSDKIIFFPSLTKTIVQYDLFEKASEYYYEEDDEFPTEYTMGIRQVAFDRIEAEGGDDDDDEMDDDMMERLSMPVQLTDDEPGALKEAAATADTKEDSEDNEKENERALANAEESGDDDGNDQVIDPTDQMRSTKPLSEAAKRRDMIDTELNGMIEEMMKSEDFEEEDEMEKESYDAIMKAAKEICYTRKYYDVSSDKIIFFPSLTKTIVQYDLFEKATEYYYEEGDEFPSEYTMGIRQVAFDRIEADKGDDDDDEIDDDIMERLSIPVQLTEDEPDSLKEAVTAATADTKQDSEDSGDDQKENEAALANAEESGDDDGNDQDIDPTDQKRSTKPLSEAAKRQDMIDTELNGMIEEMMKSEDFEEEPEMEKESYDAIMKAAKEICYTRKYYDVSSDKIIFFPSLTKTIVQYDLFEKATEYYYDEGDEFPSEYTMGIRQVAFDRIEAEGGDDDDDEMDDDMMERMSMPVQVTEDEPDALQEAAAAEEAKADEGEPTTESVEATTTVLPEEEEDKENQEDNIWDYEFKAVESQSTRAPPPPKSTRSLPEPRSPFTLLPPRNAVEVGKNLAKAAISVVVFVVMDAVGLFLKMIFFPNGMF